MFGNQKLITVMKEKREIGAERLKTSKRGSASGLKRLRALRERNNDGGGDALVGEIHSRVLRGEGGFHERVDWKGESGRRSRGLKGLGFGEFGRKSRVNQDLAPDRESCTAPT